MVDAIRTTPQETLFGSLLLLWFWALVLAGCCQLVCFKSGVLRCPCVPETGRLENMYREKIKDLAPSRARGSTWPFSQRKLSSCTYRGFPAALFSRRRRKPQNTSPGVHETTTHVNTHAYAFNVQTPIHRVHHQVMIIEITTPNLIFNVIFLYIAYITAP